jgi:hypothetical protein
MFKINSQKFLLFLIGIGGIVLVGVPLLVLAQGPLGGTSSPPLGGEPTTMGDQSRLKNPLKAETFTKLFVRIANWVAGFVAILAVLVVMIGGIQYMVAGGDEEKIKSARKTIKWALIGLVIALLSWSLLKELLGILGVEVIVVPPSE